MGFGSMGLDLPSTAGSGQPEPSADSGPLGADRIGAPLEDVRLRLLSLIDRLSDTLSEHAGPLLLAARKQLEERFCRIAVVGQIKAGKSTFINALTERPDFLPADINPWTAVVTSMHFRNSPARPEHAGVFHLFSSDQWKELADGGGRLRELTQQLVPGFQPDLLRAQLEVMRTRAERRLGARFGELLGKSHQYKEVTPQLLADYVSAGDDVSTAKTHRKIYSDITRSADLYFNESPFAYPITLIDTPGTNDPFMVRDEITRRSLETPDIYVFVISALQPLSVADISTLRLLNGLHKDRIVVFVNRVDQLPNPAANAPVVKAAVEKRLQLEFPTLKIPVICGSAWMGNLRLQARDGDLHASLKPAQVKALRQAGLLAPVDAAPARLSTAEQSRVAVAMHVNSGMREVSAALTRLMCTSSIAMLLRQITICVAELARSADLGNRAELASINELIEARRREVSTLRDAIGAEQKSLSGFEERTAALQTSFQTIEGHLNQLVGSASQSLRHQLCNQVRLFADEQAQALIESVEAGSTARAWTCDVAPLRERLLGTYAVSFEQAAVDLARVEQFLYPQLKVIVASLLPGYGGNLLEAPSWPETEVPVVAPLNDRVGVALEASGWRRWFGARSSIDDRAASLRRLIEEEFFRIADQLVVTAEKGLGDRVDHVMQRINAISAGLQIGIERRTSNLAKERALLEGMGDATSLQRFEIEQQQRVEECLRKQESYSVALREIAGVIERLDAAQVETTTE
jgi:hypothetical protein